MLLTFCHRLLADLPVTPACEGTNLGREYSCLRGDWGEQHWFTDAGWCNLAETSGITSLRELTPGCECDPNWWWMNHLVQGSQVARGCQIAAWPDQKFNWTNSQARSLCEHSILIKGVCCVAQSLPAERFPGFWWIWRKEVFLETFDVANDFLTKE